MALIALPAMPPLQAQTPPASDGVTPTLAWFYRNARDNFIGAAELMPAEHYSFQPTPDVRTFAAIVGHIADWQYTNCALMRGERSPVNEKYETRMAKPELVTALKAAYAYCDAAFDAATPASLNARTSGPPAAFPAMSAIAHPYLHYGNLVTYMRLKGLVPPSSGGR